MKNLIYLLFLVLAILLIISFLTDKEPFEHFEQQEEDEEENVKPPIHIVEDTDLDFIKTNKYKLITDNGSTMFGNLR